MNWIFINNVLFYKENQNSYQGPSTARGPDVAQTRLFPSVLCDRPRVFTRILHTGNAAACERVPKPKGCAAGAAIRSGAKKFTSDGVLSRIFGRQAIKLNLLFNMYFYIMLFSSYCMHYATVMLCDCRFHNRPVSSFQGWWGEASFDSACAS